MTSAIFDLAKPPIRVPRATLADDVPTATVPYAAGSPVATAGLRQAGRVQTPRWAGRSEGTAGRTPVTMPAATRDDGRRRRRGVREVGLLLSPNPNLAHSLNSNILSNPK